MAKIILGRGENPLRDSKVFRFKVGDIVILKISRTVGEVVSGVCFNATKPDRVFYQIRVPNGKLWTVMEDTIEGHAEELKD